MLSAEKVAGQGTRVILGACKPSLPSSSLTSALATALAAMVVRANSQKTASSKVLLASRPDVVPVQEGKSFYLRTMQNQLIIAKFAEGFEIPCQASSHGLLAAHARVNTH